MKSGRFNKTDLKRLFRCIWHLGFNLGIRYWKLQNACLVDPSLALRIAEESERQAAQYRKSARSMSDVATWKWFTDGADAFESWAKLVRKCHAGFVANSGRQYDPAGIIAEAQAIVDGLGSSESAADGCAGVTVSALAAELEMLRDRERKCPTMQEAEARSLVRALQEIADATGMLPSASPAQIVNRVRELMNQRLNPSE